jgi:putative Ca2+/H+ antiporter (TMEM165/GDT1 family)
MDPALVLFIFAVILIAELPDKSLFASLVLGTKYPAKFVWLGTASAFLVHVLIAITAGALLTLLPHTTVEAVVAILFFLGAMLIFFGKHGVEEHHNEPHLSNKQAHNPWKVFATSFSIVFIGEWGDITQIATANYAAKYHDPLSVGIGATLGLWTASALAIFAGAKILRYIKPRVLQMATGFILLGFSIYSAISIFR